MIYEFIYQFLPYHWPPDQTLATVIHHPNYQAAWRYLQRDMALIFMALIWGLGFTGVLIKREPTPPKTIHAMELLFISIGLGFSILTAAIFVLVLLRALTPAVVFPLLLVMTVIALGLIAIYRQALGQALAPLRKTEVLVIILMGFMLMVYQFVSANSWLPSDSTSYHLPYADFFNLNQGISAVPEQLIYPYHSLNFNLLYSIALYIDRDLSYLQTLHASFATLTALGIFAFCMGNHLRMFLIIGTPLFFISNVFAIHTNRFGANVDCGSMYFVLCAVFSLFLWIKNRSQWLLIASAITFGIAMGTKYLMCIFALPIAIAILLFEGRNWKPMATYILCAAIWGLWWYIRNFALTGNPVHPFATNLFGLYQWNEHEVSQHVQGMLLGNVPKNIQTFILMPFYAFKNELLTFMGASLVVSMLYLSTLFCWVLDRKKNFLLLFSWVYYVSWYMGAQEPRYLMPAIPLIFIHAGMTFHALFEKLFKGNAGKVIAFVAIVPALLVGAIYLQQEFIKVLYTNVGSTLEQKEESARENPVYDLISHANGIFDKNAVVYEFFMREGRWFYHGNLVGNQFGPHGYGRMIDNSAAATGGISAEKLEKNLTDKYAAQGFIIPSSPYLPYSQEDFDRHFLLMYRNETGAIYRLR